MKRFKTRLTFDMLMTKENALYSSIILIAVILFLTGFSILYVWNHFVLNYQLERVLDGGIKQTAVLQCDSLPEGKTGADVRNELAQWKEISAVGSVWDQQGLMNMDSWEVRTSSKSKEAKTYALDAAAEKLIQFRFYKKMSDEKITKYRKTYTPVFLGYDFRGTPLGTVYTWNVDLPEGEVTYQFMVMGILKKGQRGISSDLEWQVSEEKMDCAYNFDHYMITFMDPEDPADVRMYLSVDKQYAPEKVLQKVQEYADKNGYQLSVTMLQDRLKATKQSNREYIAILTQFNGIIVMLGLCMMVLQQVIAVLNNKRLFGILISQGFGERDIHHMIWIDHFVKALTGWGLAILLLYGISSYVFGKIQTLDEEFYHMIWMIDGILFLTAIAISGVSTLLSCLFFRKYRPINYMKENL